MCSLWGMRWIVIHNLYMRVSTNLSLKFICRTTWNTLLWIRKVLLNLKAAALQRKHKNWKQKLILETDISYILRFILKFFFYTQISCGIWRDGSSWEDCGKIKNGMSKDVALSENDLKISWILRKRNMSSLSSLSWSWSSSSPFHYKLVFLPVIFQGKSSVSVKTA